MSRNTVSRIVELMKSCRAQPMTRAELAKGLGWSEASLTADLREMEAQGLLVKRKQPSPHRLGHKTVEAFSLSPHWGGPQP